MSGIFERILLLKKSPIFSEVSTEDLQFVAMAVKDEQYFKGDKVIEINEYGEHLYIIQSGVIGITLDVDSSSFIATLKEGDYFGEMSLLDDQSRSETAVVIEDVNLLALEKSQLQGLILHYPEVSRGLLKCLSLKLREALLSSNKIN